MAIRTALLTNFVPPYRLKLLSALQDRVGELKIFVSTQMEADRPWAPDLGTLDVVQQKTKTFERTRVHPNGCSHRFFIHFPYDTIARLWRFAPQDHRKQRTWATVLTGSDLQKAGAKQPPHHLGYPFRRNGKRLGNIASNASPHDFEHGGRSNVQWLEWRAIHQQFRLPGEQDISAQPAS